MSFHTLSAKVNADPERRARVEEHQRAMREGLGLARVRESRGMTQEGVARVLGISQPNVSRVERQDDLYLSSLESYVAALGGHLEIAAVFPDVRVRLRS